MPPLPYILTPSHRRCLESLGTVGRRQAYLNKPRQPLDFFVNTSVADPVVPDPMREQMIAMQRQFNELLRLLGQEFKR